MYTDNTIAAALNLFNSQKSTGTENADGSFADIFSSRLSGGSSGNQSGLEALMNRLSERFPHAKIREAATTESEKTGAAETAKADGRDDEKTDTINVDPELATAASKDSSLAQKIEDAISAFLDSAAGSNAMAGTYTQRSVTISVTIVTYNVSRHDSGSGETLSSQDLQTSYQDVLKEKIQDLINRLFGGAESESDDDDNDETDETAKIEGSKESSPAASSDRDNFWKGDFSNYSSFSMSLYYSKTMIQSMGTSGNNAGAQNSSLQSLMFQASYQSSTIGFQSFADSILPQSIYNQMNQNSSLNGPFTSLFEGALGQMGLTSGGFSQTTDGYQFNMRNGRDFLSEFLEMAGWGKTPEIKEAEEVVEVADEAIAGVGGES